MRTSRRMLKQARRAMFVAFLFSGCINLLMLATPLYTLQVFESVVPLGSIETLVILSVITAAAIAALALIEIVRDMILLRAGLWLDHELGQHMLENGVKLGMPGHELRQDAAALDRFRSYLASTAITPLFDAPWIPIFLVALFALHPMIGGVGLASALLLIVAALSQSVLTRRLTEETARAHERSEHWWMTVAGNAQMAGALGLARGAIVAVGVLQPVAHRRIVLARQTHEPDQGLRAHGPHRIADRRLWTRRMAGDPQRDGARRARRVSHPSGASPGASRATRLAP